MSDKPGRSIFTTTDIVRILDALTVANPSYAVAYDTFRIAIGAYEAPPVQTVYTIDGAAHTYFDIEYERNQREKREMSGE